MEKYLSWKEKMTIEYINNRLILLYIEKDGQIEKNAINETACEIIQAINGERTFNQIIKFFSKKYNDSKESVKKTVSSFVQLLVEQYGLTIEAYDWPHNNKVFVKKTNMYPRVASIEITDRCNIKCLHCYGNFEAKNSNVMTLEMAKKLLEDLNAINVFVIELTGGECLTHPKFKEILLYAISLDFVQISILTNGIALTDEIKNIIIDNKDRVCVQIDMHSMNDKYLSWFTGARNTLQIIKQNIEDLAKENVELRVATIVTKYNLDEIPQIADWVYSIGVRSYAPSPVIEIGRAKGSNMGILLDQEKWFIKFNKYIEIINDKYNSFISVSEGKYVEEDNCGALSSHVAIDSCGRIKICTMDTLSECNSRIGNVFEKNIKQIYDELQEGIIAFSNISAPTVNCEYCNECQNRFFCSTCILRAFLSIKEMGDNCKWYKYALSDELKRIFF